MKIIEVIKSQCWQNIRNGRTASLYGSVPWTSEIEKHDWEVVTRGWTWKLDNGTVGLGRQPVKNLSEAYEIAEAFNARASI